MFQKDASGIRYYKNGEGSFSPWNNECEKGSLQDLEVFVEMKGFMKLFIISLRYKEYERICEEPNEGNLER